MSQIFRKFLANIFKSNSFIFSLWIFKLIYLEVKLFTSFFNCVVDFKTDAFLTRETELLLAHSCGYAINELFIYWKFRLTCCLPQRSIVVNCLPRNPKARVPTSRAAEIMNSFFFVFLFSSFFFTRLLKCSISVLSVPTLRNADILYRFPSNVRILTHIGSNDRWDKFIVSDLCEFAELHQPSSSPVPCLVPCLGVTMQC